MKKIMFKRLLLVSCLAAAWTFQAMAETEQEAAGAAADGQEASGAAADGQEASGAAADVQDSQAEAEAVRPITVEYANLTELLIAGNLDLQQQTDSYYTNKENYQSLMEAMREEQEYMKFLAKKYEDDPEAHAGYSSSAATLGRSASQLSDRLEALNRKSGTITVEKTIESFTMSAQARMTSCRQMAQNVIAKEKRVEAARSAYETALLKQSAGSATRNEVMEAADYLQQQENLLTSYRQQEKQLRFSLLSMLGISDGENVTIGEVPEPDLALIDAIDFEEDRQKAVGNSSQVQSTRHANAGTTSEIARKADSVAEAEGSAEAEITDIYQQLQAQKMEYQAALSSFGSARLIWQSLQRRKQAGMVSTSDYLTGEADYLEALAKKESAAMNLHQAYEDYCRSVRGISASR